MTHHTFSFGPFSPSGQISQPLFALILFFYPLLVRCFTKALEIPTPAIASRLYPPHSDIQILLSFWILRTFLVDLVLLPIQRHTM